MSEKDPIEAAAGSPDPAVRALALRRKEVDREAAQLDNFFRMYNGVAPVLALEASEKSASKTPAVTSEDFIAAVLDTLKAHGAPMMLDPLFKSFQQRHPDMQISTKEYFRQRLHANRQHVALLPQSGYRPAGGHINGSGTES